MSDTVAFVGDCIKKALAKQSKINDDILKLDGMSDASIRHLLNNILERPHTSYMKIGIWKGSCSISALYGHRASVDNVALIDNYSIKYEDTIAAKNILLSNIDKYLVKDSGYAFTFLNAKLENLF
jgi:hypothetical protein